MAANTLNILTPSVNNLSARIFVRAAGLDDRGLDERLPLEAGPPVRVLGAPEPQARRDVANLHRARYAGGDLTYST